MNYLNELKNKNIIVLGLGVSGLSTVRFLVGQNISFKLVDSRTSPPGRDEVHKITGLETYFGDLAQAQLDAADLIIISPGIALTTPAVASAAQAGVEIIGDIELFARINDKPVFAVTGSNGKSSVVTLLRDVLVASGKKVALAGNIGTPVLDVVDHDVDCFVLELSSFQLETTYSLKSVASCVLNVSEDHMDRYDSFEHYAQTKRRIYCGAELCVYNAEDAQTKPENAQRLVSFGGETGQYHIDNFAGTEHFIYGNETQLACSELKVLGRHNQINALSVMALLHHQNIPKNAFLTAFNQFTGLAHRCQIVEEIDGVSYVNDSKATNVGAAIAAIASIARGKNIVLIAGGVGKGADFSPLTPYITEHVKHVITLGQDGPHIAELFAGEYVSSMAEAVECAKMAASAGDIVLLAPACASLDMYANFMTRGDDFAALVKQECIS